jgi:hypothetical protein
MWNTNTYWFDVALVSTLLAFGNMAFGRFEEHRPRWRRALKIVIGLLLFVGLSASAGRAWMYALMGVLFVAVAVVHAWWLPKHGVNGWTAEPRERYFALRGLGPDGRPLR